MNFFRMGGAAGPVPSCASASGLLTLRPLERRSKTAWHDFMAATSATHIVNEPDTVTMYDGQGNTVQQTSCS